MYSETRSKEHSDIRALWLLTRSYGEALGFHSFEDLEGANTFIVADLDENRIIECMPGNDGAVSDQLFAHDYSFETCMKIMAEHVSAESARAFKEITDRQYLIDSFEAGETFHKAEVAFSARPVLTWISLVTAVYRSEESGHLLVMLSALDIDNYRARRVKLQAAMDTDFLTGLMNRRGCDTHIADYLNRHPDTCNALLALDIDNFKQINDIYGHETGDEALITLADLLVKLFGDNANIARNGGDEFMVFMKNTTAEEADRKVRELSEAEKSVEKDDQTIKFSVSIGYAMYGEDGSELVTLFRSADAALYAVKLSGKGKYARYADEMNVKKRTQLGFNLEDLAAGLPGALLIYKADESQEILFANQGLVNMFECDDLDDFLAFSRGNFHNLIIPEDLERINNEIWNQIRMDPDALTDYLDYRVYTKSGKVKQITDVGHLVYSQYYGDIFYVFLYDADQKQRMYEMQMNAKR